MPKLARFCQRLQSIRDAPPLHFARMAADTQVDGKPSPLLGYVAQHFEHAGIRVIDEWAVVGDHPQAGERYNKMGRLGDTSGRPNENDLRDIAGKTYGLLKQLSLI